MPRYTALMDSFYTDEEADLNYPCFVDFSCDSCLSVTYDSGDGKMACYSGRDETGHGHFSLTKTEGRGKASLYCMLPNDKPGSLDEVPKKMFGSWSEEGVTGMWRLSIGNFVKD